MLVTYIVVVAIAKPRVAHTLRILRGLSARVRKNTQAMEDSVQVTHSCLIFLFLHTNTSVKDSRVYIGPFKRSYILLINL